MKTLKQWLLIALLAVSSVTGTAMADESILSARSAYDFDATLDKLKDIIEKHGYTVAHVQLCDGGLKKMGYETDHYQVVFFGKIDEVREMSEKHPELVPFMPFKALIFAEGKQTVVSIVNPESLLELDPQLETLRDELQSWRMAFEGILNDIRSKHAIATGSPAEKTPNKG